MNVAIIFLAIALVAVGTRGDYKEVFSLIKADFTGPGNFFPWIVSLFFLYALGFVPSLRPVSRGLMLLVILVLFLKRGTGFFDQFNKQLGIN